MFILGSSIGGIYNFLLNTSCQFMSSKKGCSFISSLSLLAPSLFRGSLHKSFLIKSLALLLIDLGIFKGPLYKRMFTFWYFRKELIFSSCNKVEDQQLIHTTLSQVNTNQQFENDLALIEFMELNMQHFHKNSKYCYCKFLICLVQNR